MTAFVGNTNVLELTGLKNAIDDTMVSDAMVEVTIETSTGEAVTGMSWPAIMSPVSGQAGSYRLIIDSGTDLVSGTNYVAVISADAVGVGVGLWRFPFKPLTRKS